MGCIKTTEYFMKVVLDSIELRMLRRVDYVRVTDCVPIGPQSVTYLGWDMGVHIVYFP